jgi:hypothetical protein
MKKACIILALTVGIAAATWAGDFGIGGSLSNNAYGTDTGTNTAGANYFNLSLEGLIPLDSHWELDPYVEFFTRSDKDDQSISDDYNDSNYKYSQLGLGARGYYVTKIAEQFRVLMGAQVGGEFGSATWDAQTGSDQFATFVVKAPVSVEYRPIPNFAVRATVYLAAFRFYQETWNTGSTTNKYTTTNLYVVNQDATVALGAYLLF